MKNVKVSIAAITLQLIIFSVPQWSCNRRSTNLNKIINIVFYRKSIDAVNENLPTSNSLDDAKHRIYADQSNLALANRRIAIRTQNLWKGGFYGKIQYENGDSSIIAISKYDAYFVNLSDRQQYSFKNEADAERWKKLTTAFWAETKP